MPLRSFWHSSLCVSALILVGVVPGFAPAEGECQQLSSAAGHFTRPARELFDAATAVPADGANIAILEDDDAYSFDEQGRDDARGVHGLQGPDGEGCGGVGLDSIGWEPWHEARPEIRVRVITSGLWRACS